MTARLCHLTLPLRLARDARARTNTHARTHTQITRAQGRTHARTRTTHPSLTFEKDPINSVEGENQMSVEMHPVLLPLSSRPRSCFPCANFSSPSLPPFLLLLDLEPEPDCFFLVSYPGEGASLARDQRVVQRSRLDEEAHTVLETNLLGCANILDVFGEGSGGVRTGGPVRAQFARLSGTEK